MPDFSCPWETSRFPLQSEGKAQPRGKGEMTYSTLHPFLDAKTSKASSCWEHAGGITPLVTLNLGQENSKHVILPEIIGNCVQWC